MLGAARYPPAELEPRDENDSDDRRAAARAHTPPGRDRSGSCRRWAPSTPATGRCSRPPAARTRPWSRASLNPAQFAEQSDLDAYPSDLAADARARRRRRRRSRLRPGARGALPGRVRDLGRAGGCGARPRRRGPARAFPRRRHRLPEAVHARPARSRLLRAQGRPAGRGRQAARPRLQPRARDPRRTDRTRRDGLALSSRNARLSPDERLRALAIPRALATGDPDRARALLAPRPASIPTTSRSPISTAPTLAVAARVGTTRLIDNVLLEGANT